MNKNRTLPSCNKLVISQKIRRIPSLLVVTRTHYFAQKYFSTFAPSHRSEPDVMSPSLTSASFCSNNISVWLTSSMLWLESLLSFLKRRENCTSNLMHKYIHVAWRPIVSVNSGLAMLEVINYITTYTINVFANKVFAVPCDGLIQIYKIMMNKKLMSRPDSHSLPLCSVHLCPDV